MKTKKIAPLVLAGCFFAFFGAFTVPAAMAKNKTEKKMVIKSIDDSKREIKAVKDGSTFTIDTSSTTKFRKESKGSKTLKFSDFKKGDVINVTGSFDSHDVTATTVRDLSVTKSATFYGVVDSINTSTQTVKIITPKRGTITVAVLSSTKITYDGSKKKFSDIREEDKVLIRGTWNKSKKTITKTKNFDVLVKDDYDGLDD
jgi:hypothetical protein